MWRLCFWNFSDFIREELRAMGQKTPPEWSQRNFPAEQATEPHLPFCRAVLAVFGDQNTAKDAEKA